MATVIPTLADKDQLAARIALVRAPHVADLNAAVDAMSALHKRVPYFDPYDGGRDAKVLILLETPGPSDAAVRFVSRDNPNPSQRNLRRFLAQAGIQRADTLLWNTVPWLQVGAHGARTLSQGEISAGIRSLLELLPLLGELRSIILAGRIAQKAIPVLRSLGRQFAIRAMPHPSPRSLCTNPSLQIGIEQTLRDVAEQLPRPGSKVSPWTA